MPRYFFDTYDDEHFQDDEGHECANFEAARLMAMRSLAEAVRWSAPSASDRQSIRVLIRDEAGRHVYTTTLTLDGRRLGSEADRMSG